MRDQIQIDIPPGNHIIRFLYEIANSNTIVRGDFLPELRKERDKGLKEGLIDDLAVGYEGWVGAEDGFGEGALLAPTPADGGRGEDLVWSSFFDEEFECWEDVAKERVEFGVQCFDLFVALVSHPVDYVFEDGRGKPDAKGACGLV